MGWVSKVVSSVVVARAADVGVKDRRAVRGLMRGVLIEFVIEDRANRSVGERANLDRARGGCFQTSATERPRQPQDAKAGSRNTPHVCARSTIDEDARSF